MNILDLLNDENTAVGLHYYGQNDLATSWDLKSILAKAKEIGVYYGSLNYRQSIVFDLYVDYLFLMKMLEMEEIVPLLLEETDKSNLSTLITNLPKNIIGEKRGDIIQFINANLGEILGAREDVHDILDVTIDFCVTYQSGLSDTTFEYLIENYSYILFQRYSDFQDSIEKKPNVFQKLFSPAVVLPVLQINHEEILEVLQSIRKRREGDLYPLVQDAIDTILKYGNSLVQELNFDTIMYHHAVIRKIFEFLKDIRHIKAVEFEQHSQTAEKMMDEYLVERGQKWEYEIPGDKIARMLKAKGPWYNKLLQITHTLDEETGKLIPALNQKPKDGGLIDMVSTNIPTNQYFTFSHQRQLNINLQVGAVSSHILMTDKELFNESRMWLLGYWDYIKKSIEYNKNDVNDDINFLYQMLQNLFELPHDTDKFVAQSLTYGPCMLICGLTEKVMRIVYKYEKQNEIFIPLEKATMGTLLSDGNDTMCKILGKHQAKNLRFFFCTDDGTAGYDYRNKLAHWSGLHSDMLAPPFICGLMYLFLCVMASLFGYYAAETDD